MLPIRGQNNVQGASDMGAIRSSTPITAVGDQKIRARFAGTGRTGESLSLRAPHDH